MKMPEDIKKWLDSQPKPQIFAVESVTPIEAGKWLATIGADYITETGSSYPRKGDIYESMTTGSLFHITAKEDNKLHITAVMKTHTLKDGEKLEFRGQTQPEG